MNKLDESLENCSITYFCDMLKVKTSSAEFEIIKDEKNNTAGTIDGRNFDLDIVEEGENKYHVLYNNKSYRVEVLEHDEKGRASKLMVNGMIQDVTVKDRLSILLDQMGLSSMATTKVSQLKAPMPGLVLRMECAEGDQVAKGEPLLVLEAMKMENIIKAPADVVVKSIEVNQGQAVEKNEILINFE